MQGQLVKRQNQLLLFKASCIKPVLTQFCDWLQAQYNIFE